MDILIPNLGDIDEVEVTEVCVAAGEAVAADTPLIVIESDKASMEVPAGVSGTVNEILLSVGDQVGEGTLIARISAAEAEHKRIGEFASSSAGIPPATDAGAKTSPEQSIEVPVAPKPPSTPAASSAAGSTSIELLVPDLGDIESVEVIEITVVEGQEVAEGDPLAVIESDKASMDVPAERAGTIEKLLVSVGDTVVSGQPLVSLLLLSVVEAQSDSGLNVAQPAGGTGALPSATDSAAPAQDSADLGVVTTPVKTVALGGESSSSPAAEKSPDNSKRVYAGPAVRRMAREMGVSLGEVTGSGNRGRITKEDVKQYVKQSLAGREQGVSGGGIPKVPQIDFSRYGEVTDIAFSRIQKQVAENMHRSWLNVPHVTQHGAADVTDLELFRRELKAESQQSGKPPLTPLAFIVAACCHALTQFPKFNSSLNASADGYIHKRYINVGIAVDTPDGLVVPVIRNADQKSLWDLAADIQSLSNKAREKKLALDDLSGGTFTVSSLGALGGTGFTPIVNTPEVAILGVGRLATQPVWKDDTVQPRRMLPLALSYDHRVINGVDGGQFMVHLESLLGDIRRVLL